MLNRALSERYRCPDDLAAFDLGGNLAEAQGYFAFGPGTVCYGKAVPGIQMAHSWASLDDASRLASASGSLPTLPFDPTQVIDNLRMERYAEDCNLNGSQPITKKVLRSAYYSLRPLFPVSVRRHMQKAYLRGWEKRSFPHWPVDHTVEDIVERCLALSMKAKGIKEIPFIWYWPEGASACALMTHDVETVAGRDFCSDLMDINDSFKIEASFQVVPEKRYPVSETYLRSISDRGFEVAVQDLNHDGNLYSNREEFLRRAKLINQYRKDYGASGFRAAILYRNLEWLADLDFSYDMSVPNVAHLDPQSGGCCTLFPYFIGHILELPVTTTQDYSLFHIIGQYSIDLWKTQAQLILQKNGLMNFIVHPDYITSGKAQQTYKDLLAYLSELREKQNVWITLPREADRWWRARSQMKLVSDSGKWRIEGPEKERARIAFARLEDDRIFYSWQGEVPSP